MACVRLFKASAARMEEGRALYLGHSGVNTEYPQRLVGRRVQLPGVQRAAEHTKTIETAKRE